MTPARFRWGMILILLGIVLLLRNFEVLNDNFWEDFLVYFPVMLIIIGLEKIFANTKLKIISYLTSVFLLVGGLLVAFSGSLDDTGDGFFSKTTYKQDFDPTVKRIRATIEADQTSITIRDSGERLFYGKFDRFTQKPDIEYHVSDHEAILELTGHPQRWLGGLIKIETDEPQEWYLRFSKKIPLEFVCYADEADLHLNFATTPLERLKLEADDCKIYLKIGDLEPVVKVDIVGDDSSLRLRVPLEAGVKIIGDDYATLLTQVGFVEMTDGFVTKGFDTTATQINVTLDDRLKSFSIDFY